MNPQLHDEFIALCALFFSGELSDEEWALLQVHLAYCDSCRNTFEEYQQIHKDVVPALAAAAAAEQVGHAATPRFSLDDAERRLMRELDHAPGPARRRPSSKIMWTLAAVLVGTMALGATWLSRRHFTHSRPVPALQASAKAPETPPPHPSPALPLKEAPASKRPSDIARAETKALKSELTAADARYKQLTLTTSDVQRQLAAAQVQLLETSKERDALLQQLTQTQGEVHTLEAKATTINSTAQDQGVRLVNLQATVDALNASLNEKNRMLALDRQFLDHDREIRNLIAARHLYIADIYDVKDNGETAKPFGRIFYTKDTSLVFYGYDLDKQTRRNKLVSFQVWGSGDDQPNVSLGLFSRDGKQKCWILHFNDKKTLARLNKVFVTVEPPGGSNKPTGKQILMAYLRIQPNHP